MKPFARVLALVLHPVVPGFLVALYAAIEHEGGLTPRLWSIAALVTGVCVVLPLATTGIAFRLGWLGEDLYLVRRENRRFLYPVACGALALAAAIFTWVYPFGLATAMCWAALGVTLALFGFNRTVKPSIHCAGLMGVASSATWVYGLPAAPLFLLVPVVAWARVRTENHTPFEALLGSAIGGVMTIVACALLVP